MEKRDKNNWAMTTKVPHTLPWQNPIDKQKFLEAFHAIRKENDVCRGEIPKEEINKILLYMLDGGILQPVQKRNLYIGVTKEQQQQLIAWSRARNALVNPERWMISSGGDISYKMGMRNYIKQTLDGSNKKKTVDQVNMAVARVMEDLYSMLEVCREDIKAIGITYVEGNKRVKNPSVDVALDSFRLFKDYMQTFVIPKQKERPVGKDKTDKVDKKAMQELTSISADLDKVADRFLKKGE